MTLPTLAVSTIITNPFSSGYFAYLAFLESWAPFVNEIILVDGNSTDNSLDVAKSWLSESDWAKVRVINTPLTYWHPGYQWHALQAMHNYNIGLYASTCDWVATVNSDFVLCRETANDLRKILAENEDVEAVQFYRSKPFFKDGPIGTALHRRLDTSVITGGLRRRLDTAGIIVNWKRIRNTGLPIEFGINQETQIGFDFPILSSKKTTFADPSTGVVKKIVQGMPYLIKRTFDLECAIFGHYFFDLPVALEKTRRWERVFDRYSGIFPGRDIELRIKKALYGIVGHLSKEEVLTMGSGYPQEIKRVINEFYKPGMLGGAKYKISSAQRKAVNEFYKFLKLERYSRTRLARMSGYRGLNELHQWVPLDAPDPQPLDVRKAYVEQDKYLPDWCRMDWDQL